MADMELHQLAQGLYRQVSEALASSEQLTANEQMQLQQVRIRIGEPGLAAQAGQSLSELGWRLDLSFAIHQQASSPSSFEPIHSLFDNQSVAQIQGVGPKWQAWFNEQGVETVGALAARSNQQVQTLCHQANSRLPIEFYRKAQLSQIPLPPMPPEALASKSLYQLGEMSEPQWQQHMSDSQSEAWLDYLGFVSLALKESFLSRISLNELLP